MLSFVFLIIKVGYMLMFIRFSGPVMRMVFHMSKIVLYFTIGSASIIFVLACLVHTLSIRYVSEHNNFSTVYNGILVLYEFTFGSVAYIRGQEEVQVSNIIMNIFLIFFSFYGNIMLANLLVSYLSNRYEFIMEESKYFT